MFEDMSKLANKAFVAAFVLLMALPFIAQFGPVFGQIAAICLAATVLFGFAVVLAKSSGLVKDVPKQDS